MIKHHPDGEVIYQLIQQACFLSDIQYCREHDVCSAVILRLPISLLEKVNTNESFPFVTKNLAFLRSDENSNFVYTCAALGCGTRAVGRISVNEFGVEEALCLYDCHAEIMMRRAFLAFLLDSMEFLICNRNSTINETLFLKLINTQSISDMGACSEQVNLSFMWQTEVEIQLFCSSPPCGAIEAAIGDAHDNCHYLRSPKRISNKYNNSRRFISNTGLLMSEEDEFLKEKKESAPTDKSRSQNRYFDGLLKPGKGTPCLNMCCIDKILRWQCLGIQGALMATILPEPLQFTTLWIESCEAPLTKYALKKQDNLLSKTQVHQGSLEDLHKDINFLLNYRIPSFKRPSISIYFCQNKSNASKENVQTSDEKVASLVSHILKPNGIQNRSYDSFSRGSWTEIIQCIPEKAKSSKMVDLKKIYLFQANKEMSAWYEKHHFSIEHCFSKSQLGLTKCYDCQWTSLVCINSKDGIARGITKKQLNKWESPDIFSQSDLKRRRLDQNNNKDYLDDENYSVQSSVNALPANLPYQLSMFNLRISYKLIRLTRVWFLYRVFSLLSKLKSSALVFSTMTTTPIIWFVFSWWRHQKREVALNSLKKSHIDKNSKDDFPNPGKKYKKIVSNFPKENILKSFVFEEFSASNNESLDYLGKILNHMSSSIDNYAKNRHRFMHSIDSVNWIN